MGGRSLCANAELFVAFTYEEKYVAFVFLCLALLDMMSSSVQVEIPFYTQSIDNQNSVQGATSYQDS